MTDIPGLPVPQGACSKVRTGFPWARPWAQLEAAGKGGALWGRGGKL